MEFRALVALGSVSSGTRSVSTTKVEFRDVVTLANGEVRSVSILKGSSARLSHIPVRASSADVSSVTKKLGGWVVQTLSPSTLVRTAACGSDCNVVGDSDHRAAGWA